MILRLTSVLKATKYKFQYGRCIHFDGPPILERSARINLRKGRISIGRHFTMKPFAYFAVVNGGMLAVGDGVLFNRNSIIVCHESITIGDNCRFGPGTLIYDHDHKFNHEGVQKGFRTAPVIIERNCRIGAGVIILRGTHIGEGCVIGAGCVIKGDIPPHSLVTSDRSLHIVPIENRNTLDLTN